MTKTLVNCELGKRLWCAEPIGYCVPTSDARPMLCLLLILQWLSRWSHGLSCFWLNGRTERMLPTGLQSQAIRTTSATNCYRRWELCWGICHSLVLPRISWWSRRNYQVLWILFAHEALSFVRADDEFAVTVPLFDELHARHDGIYLQSQHYRGWDKSGVLFEASGVTQWDPALNKSQNYFFVCCNIGSF